MKNNKISKDDKNKFIENCLLNYEENGKNDFINLVIDDQEEEELNIKDAMEFLIDYYLNENPEVMELKEIYQPEFEDYIFGDFWEEERKGILLVTIKDGVKVS